MMKVWDAYGRIGEIPREEWRTQVLPVNFQKHWNHPDDLANLIHSSLNDGFIADCLEPARQLHRIDPQPKRGTVFLAVVLLQLKQFDEAGKILSAALSQHGEDGTLLTNLAKVQSGRGDEALAERTLWHALEVDPNQDNGFSWYAAIHRERGGEAAGVEAMRRVAALPGSWRAQLWLARDALQSRRLDEALALYRECLSRTVKPVPGDLLMQMSGDLGNQGHLPELLNLAGPHFDALTHGLQVGNNLIKAHLDLGQLDAARWILDQLYAQKRTDWKEHLSYWDTEIAKAKVATVDVNQQAPLKMAMLTIEGPVWLKPSSPAAELFPAKPADGSVIGFLGSTAEIATNSKRIQQQLSDGPGRLSRALPLFLAEQVELGSQARTQTFVPWIAEDTGGFVLSACAWTDENAASTARQGGVKCEYVVMSHLKTQAEPWTVELRLVRAIDGLCLDRLNASFPSAKPQEGIPELARQLLASLARHADAETQVSSPFYEVPAGANFPYYLLRLEQLLAVRCGSMEGVNSGFLSGEREIIDGNLQQCLACPDSASTRLLLAQTMAAMKRVRPNVLLEFKDTLALLQKEHPLREPAQGVAQRVINEALAA